MSLIWFQMRAGYGLNLDFSVSRAWKALRPRGMETVAPRLYDIISALQPIVHRRTAKSVIGRLLAATASYYIWEERNKRIFKNVRRTAEELHDIIMVT
ncbi:hypothetical protein Tco_1526781, partial [Tanacetum coccineum]